MEGINTTISYPYQGKGGLLGNPESPSSAISFGPGIFGYAKGAGVLDIGETIPLSRIRRSDVITDNRLWQKNLNIILVTTFMGKFALRYRIEDYKKVYAYLLENEHLTPFLEDSVTKLEEYFAENVKDMVLKIQSDPEDESNDGSLYLDLVSLLSVNETFKLLTKFQREWFIPTLGSKIALFNIILK